MRFGYADPPYPGKSCKYYSGHEDYAGEVDHAALIEHLETDFPDGWALSTSAAALPLRRKPDGHVTGAKPPAFLVWLFRCLGARPGDEMVELFPGSGAVALAWEGYAQQPDLLTANEEGVTPV
jgi:site-specific DNA-adenine methylase